MLRPFAVLAALLAASPALPAAKGAARLSVSAGYDSNARRDYRPSGSAEPVEGDAAMSAVGSLEGLVGGEATSATAGYDVGVRRFLRLPSEDVLIQSANVDAAWAPGRTTGLGLDLRGKDRRGGERDYTDLYGGAYLEVVPDRQLSLRLTGAGHRFLYWRVFGYSFAAWEASFVGRYRFDGRHSVSVLGDAGVRRYNALARDSSGEVPDGAKARSDLAVSAGVAYHYRGPLTLSLAYSFSEQDSNSFGETQARHRLSATGGLRLPWRLTALAQLNVQYSLFPDGVFLSPEISLAEDEESHNSLSLKVVRPVSRQVDVEVRLAWYRNWLAGNALDYDRKLALLGLTWRL